MPFRTAFSVAAVLLLTAAVGSSPSFAGGSTPSPTFQSGTFAQFNFVNQVANPFTVTDTNGNVTSNEEDVSFSLYNGTSASPVDTVHALMSFTGTVGSGPSGESNVQDISYKFVLDPSYYSGLNASNDNLLTVGTFAQPDNTVVSSNALFTKGRLGVSALSGETAAYSSDYFNFGTHNDTAVNNWTASFTQATFGSHDGGVDFQAPSGSGQFYAKDFAITQTLPTPELGSLISLAALILPAGFMLGRRRRTSVA